MDSTNSPSEMADSGTYCYHRDGVESDDGIFVKFLKDKTISPLIRPAIMCQVAAGGDLKSMEELIEQSGDVSCKDYDGRTPLHVAVQAGNTAVVSLLLNSHARLDIKDHRGHCPLFDAINTEHNRDEMIGLLLEKGAKLNYPKTKLAAELCHAVSQRKLTDLKAWHAAGADFNVADYDDRTPLHVACTGKTNYGFGTQDERFTVVKTVFDQASPEKDDKGITSIDIVKYLLEIGVKTDVKDYLGHTPLLNAVRKKNYDVIKLLREYGATLDDFPTINLALKLCRAAAARNIGILKAWKLAGADMDAADYDGRTSLHIACSGQQTFAKTLLTVKMPECNDVNRTWAYRDGNEAYSMSNASEEVEEEGTDKLMVVKYLIENGASITVRDNSGAYPLSDAVTSQQTDIIEYIVFRM